MQIGVEFQLGTYSLVLMIYKLVLFVSSMPGNSFKRGRAAIATIEGNYEVANCLKMENFEPACLNLCQSLLGTDQFCTCPFLLYYQSFVMCAVWRFKFLS